MYYQEKNSAMEQNFHNFKCITVRPSKLRMGRKPVSFIQENFGKNIVWLAIPNMDFGYDHKIASALRSQDFIKKNEILEMD